MAGQFDWLYAHQTGPVERPAQSYAETFATLDDVMARLRAKYPDQFKTQADDAEGLAERRWSQR